MPAADLTLIINTNSALSMSLGLINGPLLRHFGYRKISVIAALLFSVGLMLTALSDSIFGFIMSYGVITGNKAFFIYNTEHTCLDCGIYVRISWLDNFAFQLSGMV